MNYNPYYNQQAYQQDLMNMRDRIDKQLQQAQAPSQQQAPITQNFQLAPSQANTGIKYVNNTDEVKKELVFMDTLFVNKEFSVLWYKNASGEVKTYELKEIIEMDEKDKQIALLMAKIDKLEKECLENAKSINADDVKSVENEKSSSISSNKSSKK